MSNDKTTLADVQPGGRVRLGYRLPEAVARALATVNEAANDARHAGNYKVANALVIARVTLSKQLLALHAQPSPGGQDALATARELLATEYDKAGERVFADRARKGQYDNDPDVHAIVAALAARQPVVEPVDATDAMVEAALQSTVANNASPWRQVVASEDHADFISDMRAAISAALAARPSPITAEATTTSTQTVPDHCDRIFWQHNYYELPVGPTDQKKPTRRRQTAVETLLNLGFMWRNGAWIAPPAQAVDLGQFREAVAYAARSADFATHVEIGSKLRELLALIDGKAAGNGKSVRIADLEQILLDPENQPSQFGTVPTELLEKCEEMISDLVHQFGDRGCTCTFPEADCCAYARAEHYSRDGAAHG
ncbi:hypothetical protein [Stenotrophomonas sp. RAC2]|uniref:hypothetical protein n=1 Tax=Stenotrophomonas sp. RAC2 TaxID=3064902 RepID=UPI00271D8C6D|nr:hypothetical protein [Stenotrophomonas sp. RAC2]MDV9041005.1 hypothetical protein [Stenotrophomonas sp. RAC2]